MAKYFITAKAIGSRARFYKEFQADSDVDAIWRGLKNYSKQIQTEFGDATRTRPPLKFELRIEKKLGESN